MEFRSQGRYYLLSSIFLFHSLSDNEKNIIAERCQIKDLKRHENLYHKGQDGDYFYIIINGSVEVYLPTSSETSRIEEVVDILRKGDTLGIVSILEKKPHSFSARALGNVRLLLIDEKDLTYIMQTIPSFNAIITRVLSKRLKASIGETKRKVIESSIISVYSPDTEDLGSKYAVELSENIINQSKRTVVVLRINKKNITPIKAKSKIKIINYDTISEIIEHLNQHLYSYNIIIIDLPNNDFEKCKTLLAESDYCHYLTYSDNITKEEFFKSANLEQGKLRGSYLRIIKVLRSSGLKDINKLTLQISREVTGVRCGLALGGGAAFGLSQIGALKVLEKENIKIDMVSGTSIGSLVGALWCCGITAVEIESITKEINSVFNLMKFVDVAMIPKKGFILGNNIRKFLEKFLGTKTFNDLNTDLRIISCDINTRDEVVIRSGSIVDAIMASTAIPGLFNPVRQNDMVLVDGGVVNPLPVSTLSVEGINRIIAINAMPSPYDIVSSNRVEQSILDIFINSFYSLQYRLCKYSAQGSDVYLSPILPNSSWYEFYRAQEFIDFGEKVCDENLREIKKLVRK